MAAIISTLNIYIGAAVAVFLLGFVSLVLSRNMVRMIIGLEIMARAATLSIIAYGSARGNTSLSQALVVTIIVVEVVVTSIALALIMNIHNHSKSTDVSLLNKLKG